MTESTPRQTAPEAPPHGRVSTIVRLLLAMTGIAALTIPYFCVCVLLLPWRALRLRIGNAVGATAGRWVHGIVGLSHEVSGPDLASLAPALFVMNHTGTLDLFLAMQLCPAPGSGTMKREFLRIPFLGLGYFLSGHLLVDRGNRARAIKAMDSVGELVRDKGISIWILPEGTRSRDGRLQPFKKGFAYLALATRLPVVPVVVHDGHQFWPRGLTVRPGRVAIDVLDPIPTTDWTRESLDEHIAELEDAFARTLAEHQRPASASDSTPSAR